MNFKKILDKKAQQLWNKNFLLQAYLNEEELTAIEIQFPKLSSRQLQENFVTLRENIAALECSSRGLYHIHYQTIHHQKLGIQHIPVRVVFQTVENFLHYINKQVEYEQFCETVCFILAGQPKLKNLLQQKVSAVLQYRLQWPKILSICHYFLCNPKPNVYLRMLNIPGVDTKFIENYQNILCDLLDVLLPSEAIDHKESLFAARYFLKQEQPLIRFRWLDNQSPFLFRDLTVTLSELAKFEIPCETVFITENKTNGLCFPNFPKAIVIFGLGFGVSLLRKVSWLANKNIYYWGDIDTHGFAMLSQLRSFLPHTKNLFMNREILMQFKDYWVKESGPHHLPLKNLDDQEQDLYQALCHNLYGENIRLEQERIDYQVVLETIKLLTLNRVPHNSLPP